MGRLGGLWAGNPVAFWLVLAACAYFVVMAVRLTVIDVRHHLLPNRIIFPSYAIVGLLLVAAAALGDAGSGTLHDGGLAATETFRVLAGAGLLWLFYYVLRRLYPPGMGFGDVKLAGVLGLYLGFLGWGHLFAGTFLAFLLGGSWSVILLVARRGTLKTAIPFGPFMLAGAFLALLLPA